MENNITDVCWFGGLLTIIACFNGLMFLFGVLLDLI